MDPINYQIQVAQPFQSALHGYQIGMGIQQQQEQQRLAEMQRAQQQAMQDDLMRAARDPTLIPGLMVRYPQLAEKLKVGNDAMTAEQQRGDMRHIGSVASALASNRPDVAAGILRDRATALRNSGGSADHIRAAEDMAKWAETDPGSLRTFALAKLSTLPDGDKAVGKILDLFKDQRDAAEEARKAARAPADLRAAKAAAAGAEAEATVKGVKAKYAETETLLDLKKKGWDITKVQSDIEHQKAMAKIAAMNAAISRETNQIRREELQLQVRQLKNKLDADVRDRVATVETGRSAIDNFLNTADKALAFMRDPKREAVVRAAHGPVDSRLPTVQQDVADYEALIETLGAQAFISQIPSMKGTGALSEREGDKLQSSLQSLSLKQSPAAARASLEEIQRLMLKARKTLETRHGIPSNVPDTPAAAAGPTGQADVDALVRKYLGQ